MPRQKRKSSKKKYNINDLLAPKILKIDMFTVIATEKEKQQWRNMLRRMKKREKIELANDLKKELSELTKKLEETRRLGLNLIQMML